MMKKNKEKKGEDIIHYRNRGEDVLNIQVLRSQTFWFQGQTDTDLHACIDWTIIVLQINICYLLPAIFPTGSMFLTWTHAQ